MNNSTLVAIDTTGTGSRAGVLDQTNDSRRILPASPLAKAYYSIHKRNRGCVIRQCYEIIPLLVDMTVELYYRSTVSLQNVLHKKFPSI
jgi:hypothetical protein